MKNERKHLYALTKREDARRERTLATESRQIRRRIWESAIGNSMLATQAAYALAHPIIEANKKVLVLTALEADELFKCLMNGYDNGEYVDAYCRTAASKKAFARVQKKLRELW